MTSYKNNIKQFLLSSANIKRLHIVGCARSGTTMLHYAMASFKNTILCDNETEVWNSPNISQSMQLFAKIAFVPETYFYVTKRSYDWWHDSLIERLSNHIIEDNIFLINIIRDPRDVLTSSHRLSDRKYYVEPDRWLKSINAGEELISRLGSYPNKLTIRYEDILLQPDVIKDHFQDKFSLKMNPLISDWSKLKDNSDKLSFGKNMISYMHKLRNFDPGTIGKWKSSEDKTGYIHDLLSDEKIGPELRKHLEKYNYD